VALAIMAGTMAVIILTFTVTVSGWRRGADLLEGLHHGDYVMEQLVSSLRSAAFFYNDPTKYGFWLEDLEGQDYPADRISFVTAGTAFMPPNSPLGNGLHRIEITVHENDDGDPAVAIRAFPHLTDQEDWELEPWYVSTVVKGLNIRTYNQLEEDWEDEWEDTNAVPSLVEVTLFMDPLEDDGSDPITLSRLVEVPIAPAVPNAVAFRDADEAGAQEAEEAAAGSGAGIDQTGGADTRRRGSEVGDRGQGRDQNRGGASGRGSGTGRSRSGASGLRGGGGGSNRGPSGGGPVGIGR
jgi:hypothetical protein